MCGVFGVRSPDRDVARLAYFGLFALQHRGQESAGIAVSDKGRLTVVRDMGLVAQVFDEEKLQALPGDVAIGHARYSTTGSTHWSNAQPLVHHGSARTVALGHNGNLTNTAALRTALAADRVPLGSTSDTEVIAALVAHDEAPLATAVAHAMARLEGAYSVVALAEGKLVAFRDPHGIRPLVLGRLGADWVVASETCALDLVGATFERDVRPGEVVVAAEAPIEADLVMPVPDSATPAAVGYARASGIPYSEGLIRNRYVGRTFIQPDDHLRRQGIKLKFNPLAEVAGKRLVVVDDSIVRSNTTRQLVVMLHEAGASEVHLRISSPPIVSP